MIGSGDGIVKLIVPAAQPPGHSRRSPRTRVVGSGQFETATLVAGEEEDARAPEGVACRPRHEPDSLLVARHRLREGLRDLIEDRGGVVHYSPCPLGSPGGSPREALPGLPGATVVVLPELLR